MDFIGRNRGNDNVTDYSLIEDSRTENSCHFTVRGRVSVNESSHLENALKDAVEEGITDIIINMNLVSQLSSVGIRVLITMHKIMRAKRGRLRIESPSENVRNVIGMVALNELMLE